MGLWRGLYFLGAAFFGFLYFAAQTPPQSAMSNLQQWAEKLGVREVPVWVSSPTADQVVSMFSAVLAIGLALAGVRVWALFSAPKRGLTTHQTKTVDEPKPPRVLPDGRIIVGVTPEYLANLYKVHTSLRGSKIAEEYTGNWMQLSGSFGDVTSPSPYYASTPEIEQRMVVTFAFRPEYGGPLVIMYFNAKRWQKYLEALVKNQEISVRCQIARSSSTHVELEKCEFINPQTDKVIESEPEKQTS
jgi:hypothetical protein